MVVRHLKPPQAVSKARVSDYKHILSKEKSAYAKTSSFLHSSISHPKPPAVLSLVVLGLKQTNARRVDTLRALKKIFTFTKSGPTNRRTSLHAWV